MSQHSRSKALKVVWFPLTGLLLTLIGLPFYLRMVKPNHWSGVRTPKTYSDPEIWYDANRIMGRNFIVAGALVFIVSIGVQMLAQKNPLVPATKINTFILLGSLGVAVLLIFLSLNRM